MALPPPRRPDGSNPQKPAPKAPPGKLPPLPKVDVPAAEPDTTSQAAQPPAKRPPTGEQRAPGPRMAPGPQGPGGKRNTSMLSLEPPKRQDGPRLAPGARMDGIGARMKGKGGPAFSSTRMVRGRDDKADLFGKKKTDELAKRPPQAEGQSFGGKEYDPNAMMARHKGTRRVPKPGGGVMGDNNRPLDSMTSDRRPAVPSQPGQNMPPVAGLSRSPEAAKRPDLPPPPPSTRTSTLAGVSAEELLGEEGKALMEQVKNRQHDKRGADYDTRKVKQGGLYGDPSRAPTTPQQRGPISPIPVSPLPPQGPVSPIPVSPQPYVAQPQYVPPPPQFPTPQQYAPPQRQESAPSDDLGYDKPVDFGGGETTTTSTGADGETVYEEEEVSAADIADEEQDARESQAQEEMEQRVGYLLWLQGVITVEEVEEALNSADPREARQDVMALLNNSGFTGQESLYRFLARHESLAPVDLGTVVPTDSALATLRPAVARAYRVVPLSVLGKILLVAASMPFEPQRLLELRSLTGRKIKVFVTSTDEIDSALKKYYPGGPKAPSGRQAAVSESTGEVPKPAAPGEKLEQGYDPTVSGHDSGLYAPIKEGAPPPVAKDVALEEEAGTTPVTTSGGFSATDSTKVARDDVASSGDLDESGLGSTPDPLGDDDNELKLGDDAAGKPEEKKSSAPIDSGPEDLDPFGD